jgi:YEATS domain-containing protein 4
MAPPPGAGKRVKGVQIFRPFIYGTTARPFDEKTNPKPAGVPDDHTHSWTVFVKGIDDTDITYWLRRVQFKLHESIPNHVRVVEAEPGKPFEVHETGWGEFEITLKLYYVSESSEKPQTLYQFLRLHPYGRTEEEKEAMRLQQSGEVISWVYEEQVFNEPYEPFYEILTSGALPPPNAPKGKGKGQFEQRRTEGGVLERSALIPLTNRPGQPFSRETEQLEIKKLKEAGAKVQKMAAELAEELKKKEQRLRELKAEAGAGKA